MPEEDEATIARGNEETKTSSDAEPSVSIRRSTLLVILAAVIVALALGAGGYSIGKNSGEDLEAAKAKGTSLGTNAAEDRGQAQGFRAGFKKGKALGFAVSFNQAYKRAYIDTWEEAGLEAPAKNEIKVASR